MRSEVEQTEKALETKCFRLGADSRTPGSLRTSAHRCTSIVTVMLGNFTSHLWYDCADASILLRHVHNRRAHQRLTLLR
jgi:hypothetical protein